VGMKRIRNIQLSSTETDRKVMLRVSFVVLILLWLLAVAMLTLGWLLQTTDSKFVWDARHLAPGVLLTLLCLLIIPIQLRRYLRELRSLRGSSTTTPSGDHHPKA